MAVNSKLIPMKKITLIMLVFTLGFVSCKKCYRCTDNGGNVVIDKRCFSSSQKMKDYAQANQFFCVEK